MTSKEISAAELAELKRELAALKSALKPANPAAFERELAEWKEKMHEVAEARAARFGGFSPEDLRAMNAAAPADVVSDLVSHGTVPGPSGAGKVSGQVKVSSGGSGTGWVNPRPIGPPPGVAHCDRMMDAADARDRRERERKGE
jgi:hypothetical protein